MGTNGSGDSQRDPRQCDDLLSGHDTLGGFGVAEDDPCKGELEKYERAYKFEDYRMGSGRAADARGEISLLVPRTSLLDVGCGRGEMVAYARGQGFSRVLGVEYVPALCDGENVIHGSATALPFAFDSFDHVVMFDVLEHLPRGAEVLAVNEVLRVARTTVLLTAANKSHRYRGVELHINLRPFDEWDEIIRDCAGGNRVQGPIRCKRFPNALWRIHLS